MTAIPFVRDFSFEYEKAEPVSERVQRLVANNPGPFTYTGTGVYIIGSGKYVAVIDPGPNVPGHEEALLAALDGRQVSHVLVTHHHLDHSPMARPLARHFDCEVYGYGVQIREPDGGEVRMEAGDDLGFRVDVEIRDGDVVQGDGWTIEALHTPGHTSNHMCYTLREENCLFSGDHVMGWSTSVVSPPDGHMGQYLASLERVKALGFDRLYPTHGPFIDEPTPFIDAYIEHRHRRTDQVLEQFRAGQTRIKDMVPVIYADVDKRLYPAAAHSVLAHVIMLVEDGILTTDGEPHLDSTFALAS